MATEADKTTKPAAMPPVSSPASATPSVSPASKAGPPGGNAVAAHGLAQAPGFVELQGQPTFSPSADTAAFIQQQGRHGAAVQVKFGNISKVGGPIHVAHDDKGYHTIGEASIPIDFEWIAKPLAKFAPALHIEIDKGTNAITGFAAPKGAGQARAINAKIHQVSDELGLVGFKLPELNLVNKIENGVFKLGTDHDLKANLAGWIEIGLGFGLENDRLWLHGAGTMRVRGLAEAKFEVTRDAAGVHGKGELDANISKFSGKATATYLNGEVEIVGTLSYSTEKLHGTLTIVVMDAKKAEQAAHDQIDPQHLATESTSDKEKGKKPDKFKPGERGIAGWGELDFAFTDWFTGKAKAIFGPAGYITIIGKIAPPKSIELMKERNWNKRLFGLDLTARYGLPYVADVNVGIGIELGAAARLGPAELTDIVVEGVYSTDPTVLNAFSITGAFRISAYAGLNLRFDGHAGLTILGHDIDFGAAVTGKAGVKGYAEARPTLGYREKADPVAGKKGEYFLKGHMEIAAQPFVGLDGELFVKLDSPWWSPAPDKTWTWPLFSLEYPLPGQFGIGADIDYVIGSGQFPEITWGKADFDASKFKDSLLDSEIPPKKVGGDVAKPGTWKGEMPPPPTAAPAPKAGTAKAPGTAEPKAGSAKPTAAKGGQKPEEAANVAKTPDAAKRFAEGMQALGELHQLAEKDPETNDEIHTHLAAVKKKYGFTTLEPHLEGDYWVIDTALNPTNKNASKKATIKAKKATHGPANLPKSLQQIVGQAPTGSADKRIKKLESEPYDATTAKGRGKKGDKLTGDHIPSNASLQKAALILRIEEVRRSNPDADEGEVTALGSKLMTTSEKRQIRDQGLTIVLPEGFHAKFSRTFGGRNTAAKILADALQPELAVWEDFKAELDGWKKQGKLTVEVVAAYTNHYENLVGRKVLAGPSRNIHELLLGYLKDAKR